ncbi:MAG: VPLPA-CTERM sorting domain-containing protein [Thiotrichales bacterium]
MHLDLSAAEYYGNNTVRQFTFHGDLVSPLAFVALKVGDDGGNGYNERLAVANFIIGTQPAIPVPLPATLPLFFTGLAVFVVFRRRVQLSQPQHLKP